jgi:hypothetical protein
LGFIAENIREHFAEEKITQQYLESLQVELNHNKTVFPAADSLYKTRLPIEDSIVKIFLAKKENADLFWYGKAYTHIPQPVYATNRNISL